MKAPGIIALLMMLASIPASAGEVYGNVTENGRPAVGMKVEIKSGSGSYSAETDRYGSYRLFVKERGNCKLTIAQSAPVEIASYDRSVRYNLILEKKDGKYTLTIK